MILRGADIRGPLKESADVCIIGSGCGGGASAKVLAESGKKVLVLEEGGYFAPADFSDWSEELAYRNLYQGRGGQATDDLSVTVLQGRTIGGSSTVNWTTTLRTPEIVLDRWAAEFGLAGLGARDLEPYFERIERYLNVTPEPEERHNPNNRILLEGASKLGYRVAANGRNVRDCVKAGACGLGCPFGAKLSVDLTYLPDAARAGARVYADCRAERIEIKRNAKLVTGHLLDRIGRPAGEFSVEAPVVIVSASAIRSPLLLLNSGLGNSSGMVGRNLTFHLTSAVIGEYDRTIYGAGGIPQSIYCDEFLDKNGDGGGFWFESVPIYPLLAALSLPGFGTEHRMHMQKYPHLGAVIVLVKETDSVGSVTPNPFKRPVIRYSVGRRDLSYLKEGLREAARIHFAAGAKSVMSLHSRMLRADTFEKFQDGLTSASWGPNDLGLYSAHPLGTCRMGKDRLRSVLDTHCQVHDLPGLFVIDGSFTPTSLGVNPQLTILAVAEKSAEWIAENFTRLHF